MREEVYRPFLPVLKIKDWMTEISYILTVSRNEPSFPAEGTAGQINTNETINPIND